MLLIGNMVGGQRHILGRYDDLLGQSRYDDSMGNVARSDRLGAHKTNHLVISRHPVAWRTQHP